MNTHTYKNLTMHPPVLYRLNHIKKIWGVAAPVLACQNAACDFVLVVVPRMGFLKFSSVFTKS